MRIDDTVFVADGAKIIGDDLTIGASSSVWYNTVIRSDDGEFVHIGERTNIQDLSMVHTSPGASTTIGNGVTIGHSCIIHGCTVGDGCHICLGAIVKAENNLPEGLKVEAGQVIENRHFV